MCAYRPLGVAAMLIFFIILEMSISRHILDGIPRKLMHQIFIKKDIKFIQFWRLIFKSDDAMHFFLIFLTGISHYFANKYLSNLKRDLPIISTPY